MPQDKQYNDNSPSISLLALILFILLLLLLSPGSPEKERELREKLQEKKKALEYILTNVDEANAFKLALLKDMKKTTFILRWVVFTIVLSVNIVAFKFLDYALSIKNMIECAGIVTGTIFSIVYIFFFLRYGKFVEIKNAYHELQLFVLKLRYDKTEEQVEAYLTAQIEDKNALEKDIADIEAELKRIDEAKMQLEQRTLLSLSEINESSNECIALTTGN